MTPTLTFPEFSGTRCLMMPYIQGDPDSIPDCYASYREIVATTYLNRGDVGFLTIDESRAFQGTPHRGAHSKFERALHTEVGWRPYSGAFVWGGGGWGDSYRVTLDPDVEILLANNLDDSCAVWDAVHSNTSADGDIGDKAHMYPLSDAVLMRAGEVHRIGILTPHESLPVDEDVDRQFLRIVGSGVYGREPYFTANPQAL